MGTAARRTPPANRQDGPFAGVWATNEKACSPQLNRDGLLPALISSQGAWAGETTCSFKKSKRVGNTWTFAAVCADSRRRWRADVRMSVVGNRLTWTSQRGSQTYVGAVRMACWRLTSGRSRSRACRAKARSIGTDHSPFRSAGRPEA